MARDMEHPEIWWSSTDTPGARVEELEALLTEEEVTVRMSVDEALEELSELARRSLGRKVSSLQSQLNSETA